RRERPRRRGSARRREAWRAADRETSPCEYTGVVKRGDGGKGLRCLTSAVRPTTTTAVLQLVENDVVEVHLPVARRREHAQPEGERCRADGVADQAGRHRRATVERCRQRWNGQVDIERDAVPLARGLAIERVAREVGIDVALQGGELV